MSIENLKKKRATLRAATSRLFTKIEAEISQSEISFENLEILLEQLNDKEKSLSPLDIEIELLTSENELEKEIENREIYKENIILWRTRTKRILNKSQNTPFKQAHENIVVENTFTQQQSVHLPKLSIQKFDGNPSKFLEFWQSFENSIHNNKSLSDIDKFNYLKSLLSGSAYHVISGFSLTNENYSSAIGLLKERFGRQDILQNVHMLNLLKIQPLRYSNDVNGLKNLHDKCETEIRSLEALGIPKENFGVLLCPLLMQKIPLDLQLEYNRSREIENWSLDDLMKFIKKELICRERVYFSNKFDNRNKNFPNRNQVDKFYDNKVQFNRNLNKPNASAAEFVTLTENKCIFCDIQDDHVSQNCDVINVAKKKEILKKQGRCFRCLKKNHLFKECRSNIKCSVCRKNHSEAICYKKFNVPHADNDEVQEVEPLASTVMSPVGSQMEDERTVSLQTGSITVYAKQNIGNIRFLCDTGAQTTFVSRKVVRDLNLPVIGEEKILIHAFQSSNTNYQKFRKVKLGIKSKINDSTIFINALETDEITKATLKFPDTNIRHYLHLEGIELADRENCNNLEGNKISLLLGADNYFKIVTGRIKRINSSLVCMETHAGWVLCGCDADTSVNNGPHVGVYNTVVLKAVTEDETSLRKFWELDAIGITDGLTNSRTVSDDEAMHIFDSSVKFENSRYEVCLPWKYENVDLPNNFYNAKKRLDSLYNRFKRDPVLYCDYKAVIEDYINTGIIEEVKEPQEINSQDHPVYYLPQSPVVKKDRETTKLRIVYDASSHSLNSPSLNDLLHPGPNLNPDLLNLVLQFRLNRIAVVCDIKQAFLNIGLRESDRDAVRFLWYEQSSDGQNELKVFRFTRVLFGVTSSPFLLAAVIKKHIYKYKEDYPDAFNALNESLYVDDLLSGSTSVEDAFKLSEETKTIMMEANMTLRKWKTNSPKLKNLWENAEFEISPSEENREGNIEIKVLGLSWNTVTDVFKFDVSHLKQFVDGAEKTKRTVIRASGRIFDPAGYLTPFTVRVKILFQELWVRKIDWDQQLPPDLTKVWNDWCEELPNLNLIEIPRYYFGRLEFPTKKIEVHCFTDASEKSYGGVVYVRYEENNKPKVSFVSSKTRISPLRKSETHLSIPRLELMAALIGARLIKHLSPVFEKFDVSYYYWTDSSITYYWIRSNYEKFKPFVGNRIKEIQALSYPNAWSHCPGQENPADLLSRGLTSSKLKDNRLWWNGPTWLSQSKKDWPKTFQEKEMPQETKESADLEMKKTCSVNVTQIVDDDKEDKFPIQRYSSFNKTCRVMAWCLRFINNCKKTLENRNKKYLQTSELKNATLKLIEIVQGEEYKTEIKCLKKNKPLPNNSKILSLNAFLDTNNLLRVGGRLEFSNLSYDQKHQLLLPKNHHLTKLIIEHCHILSLHAGTQTTLSLIRQKYWIPSGRDRVQRVLSKCMICFRTKNKTLNQLMSNLPKNRIVPSRPFSKVGIDFAGPITTKPNLKRSRVQLKHYIALFICFCTKAVHLEIVSDLTTEAFLASLKRFIARRSVPFEIYSDNATNFVGARNIFNQLCKTEEIQKFSLEKEITWHFIPPLAPNFGGLWEANIKTMKKHLIKATQGSILNYEELNTLVVQIEACLNSRPLTPISSDPSDLQPLTPGHFLVGGPLLSTPEEDPSPNITLKSRWALLQELRNRFWRRWSQDYLTELQQRMKWGQKTPNLEPGQLVVIKEKDLPPQKWKLGRVLQIFPGQDGLVRVAQLKTATGDIKRAVSNLCPLPFNDVELRSTGGGVFRVQN